MYCPVVRGQRPFIAFLVLACHFNWIISEPDVVTNCTVDDLRKINSAKSEKSPLTPDFVFSDCNLTLLQDAIFLNVKNSKSIEFVLSNISAIAANLNKLEELTIVGNSNLTAHMCIMKNVYQLCQLNVYKNGIRDLHEFDLRTYSKLKRLNLQENLIKEIPVGFFDFVLNLETLNLNSNSLKRIESYTFKALLRLIDLNMAYNQINFIDSYAFTTTTRLKTLRLNGNQLARINSMVFYNLGHLEYLNLSENSLNDYALEEDAFQQNSQLLHLDISHNSIISIQTYALSGLKALQV